MISKRRARVCDHFATMIADQSVRFITSMRAHNNLGSLHAGGLSLQPLNLRFSKSSVDYSGLNETT